MAQNMAPTSVTSEQPPSSLAIDSGLSFLDLPYELRLQVYSHLFASSKLSCETPHATWPACGYSICSCQFHHQILSACHQLRSECLPLLLSATTLEVAGSFDRIVAMPAHIRGKITQAVVLDAKLFSARPLDAQLEQLPGLEVLELRNITVWCKFYDEVFLESAAADEAMYAMACFNLQRIGKRLGEVWLFGGKGRSFKVRLCCQFVVNSLNDETIHAVVDVDEKKIVHKSRGPPMKNFHSWSGFY